MKKLLQINNLHLTISSIIVIPIAFFYGFAPEILFHVNVVDLNEHSIFKAIMGIYLAFGTLWIFGIYKNELWQTATVCNMLFMFGLAFGRIFSFFIDGFPDQ